VVQTQPILVIPTNRPAGCDDRGGARDEDAKTIANHVKINILAGAGFDDIEVATSEFTTFFSGG
jgi:hypothetical protein